MSTQVIINQSPTLPNGTQADIIYTLECPNSSSAQFKYICQIKDDENNVLAKVKQSPNNTGLGVYDVGRLLDAQMGYDPSFTEVGFISSSNNNIRNFEIAFGAESGSSASSSLIEAVDVSASLSSSTAFIPAVQERDSGYFNWQSGSYDILTNCPNALDTFNETSAQNALIVSSSDYLSLSTLQGVDGNKGDLTSMRIDFYNTSSFSSAFNYTEANPHASTLIEGRMIHAGVGPKNIQNLSGTIAAYLLKPDVWPYYSVYFTYASGTSKTYFFHNQCQHYKGTNFAFINKLGVFDFYRATLVDTEQEQFNRRKYDASYVDYSTQSKTIAYQYSRRGETQYYANFKNTFTAETDWLTQEQADWLFELFESPSVYVQNNGDFVGVVITNANEQYKTNNRGQKVFKFTIRYTKSNSKRART